MEVLQDVIKELIQLNSDDRRKLRALVDCIYFGETYIKPFDKEWKYETAKFHKDLIEIMNTEDRIQIHVPFEHAKTTWCSIVFPIWQILRDPDVHILILSATPTLVKKILRVIKWHLDSNYLIKRDFPYIKRSEDIEKWEATQIIVDRSGISKDPTIEVVGMGGSILGGRFHFIIGDDVCNRHNMNTLELRNNAEDWWKSDVTSRVTENGKIFNIGTLWHQDDLGVRLSNVKTYHYYQKKAIINEETGETLWPEAFPIKRLRKIREEVGTIVFLRGYQNEIASFKGKLLNPEWLNYYKLEDIDLSNLLIYFGVDPDMGELTEERDVKNHCYFSIVVLGLETRTSKIYVLETFYDVLSFPAQMTALHTLYNKWHPMRITIENNAYQKALAQQAFLAGLPVLGQTTTKSKEARFIARSVDFETKRLYILRNMNELITEYTYFPSSDYNRDVLDALDIGVQGIGLYNELLIGRALA